MQRFLIVLLAIGFIVPVLMGCDAGEVEPDVDALQVSEVIFARPDGSVVAYSHDDHWHGTLRATVGESTTLDVWIVTADTPGLGHDVPPRDAWARPSAHDGVSLRITSDDETVAVWSGSGDTFTVASSAVGAALTTVVVLEGPTTRYQSPPAPTIASQPTAAPGPVANAAR